MSLSRLRITLTVTRAFDQDSGLIDGERPGPQINIRPAQAEYLTTAQAVKRQAPLRDGLAGLDPGAHLQGFVARGEDGDVQSVTTSRRPGANR